MRLRLPARGNRRLRGLALLRARPRPPPRLRALSLPLVRLPVPLRLPPWARRQRAAQSNRVLAPLLVWRRLRLRARRWRPARGLRLALPLPRLPGARLPRLPVLPPGPLLLRPPGGLWSLGQALLLARPRLRLRAGLYLLPPVLPPVWPPPRARAS